MADAMPVDEALADIVLSRGFVTRKQLEDTTHTYQQARKLGLKTTLLKVLEDKGLIDEKAAAEVRTELEIRGVRPKLGEYELIEKLGEGGMGTVFKAKHPRLNSVVALKILLPEIAGDPVLVQRLEREARLAARLQEADIVHVLDVQQVEGQHFIVMEYVEGESLEARLAREGRLPEEEALRITRDVARALSIAHQNNIIHRDMKPSNILLTRSGKVKVGDFGLSKDTAASEKSLTQSGASLGSPLYIAPEQVLDTKRVDKRADIYSLGATLFHMVTGASPFSATSTYEMMLKHIMDPLQDPRDTNPGLSRETSGLIRRMMEKNPAKRIQSCEEVAFEAEHIRKRRQMLALQAAPVMVQRRQARRKGRRLWIPIAAGIAALAILATAAVFLLADDSKPPAKPTPRKTVTTRTARAKAPAPAKTSTKSSAKSAPKKTAPTRSTTRR